MKQYRDLGDPLDGADVVLIGLFSAKEKQYEDRLDKLAALVQSRGVRAGLLGCLVFSADDLGAHDAAG